MSESDKYGVTWATSENSVFQTGYVFDTAEQALDAAKLGPYMQTTQVDPMEEVDEYLDLYGRVETEHDTGEEILVGTIRELLLEFLRNMD